MRLAKRRGDSIKRLPTAIPNVTGQKGPYMKSTSINNRILWIIGVTFVWYIVILSILEEFFGITVLGAIPHMSPGMRFVMSLYFPTIVPLVGLILFLYATQLRNRFVLDAISYGKENNNMSTLWLGILIGFVMNGSCILIAILHGDIFLRSNFSIAEIPFYIWAFICVFIQSTSEEVWCRGFMYERINVHYPLWVAILVNGSIFGLLHIFNPGVGVIPIVDIIICGISFSLLRWYTDSIWCAMGVHTMWNFTQNFIFGLPNSGIVSQASIFALDAAVDKPGLLYNVDFGVEGAIPAVIADLLLGVICLYLGYKNGRLGELKMRLEGAPNFNPVKR